MSTGFWSLLCKMSASVVLSALCRLLSLDACSQNSMWPLMDSDHQQEATAAPAMLLLRAASIGCFHVRWSPPPPCRDHYRGRIILSLFVQGGSAASECGGRLCSRTRPQQQRARILLRTPPSARMQMMCSSAMARRPCCSVLRPLSHTRSEVCSGGQPGSSGRQNGVRPAGSSAAMSSGGSRRQAGRD